MECLLVWTNAYAVQQRGDEMTGTHRSRRAQISGIARHVYAIPEEHCRRHGVYGVESRVALYFSGGRSQILSAIFTTNRRVDWAETPVEVFSCCEQRGNSQYTFLWSKTPRFTSSGAKI